MPARKRPTARAARTPRQSSLYADKLQSIGMTAAAAQAKQSLMESCDDALSTLGAPSKRWSLWVPGRIEVLGKHTDYAGGRSLLCALERGFCARVAPRSDPVLRLVDVGRGLSREFPLSASVTGGDDWTGYVAAVVRRLTRNFPMVTNGADVVLASDLPRASGMSSSSALLITVFIALGKTNDMRSTPEFRNAIFSREELAAYLACIENGNDFRGLVGDSGVGTLGGSQDHTAIVASEAGKLVRYAWSPLRKEGTLPIPKDLVFAIASSGVTAEKTAGARDSYNRASLTVRHLLRVWNAHTYRNDATLADALHSGPEAADRLRRLARDEVAPGSRPELQLERLEHFLVESDTIIPAAVQALAKGEVGAFGAYVDWSQWATERLLQNQVPETMFLARTAREVGAVAASAFGAGFGGSVWALVPREDATRILKLWEQRYRKAYPERIDAAEFFLTNAGPAAHQW
ncbi:MAG: galactokinase family protein [Gemmatimonadaceae bacterium]